jgi:hypothetical protein
MHDHAFGAPCLFQDPYAGLLIWVLRQRSSPFRSVSP